MGYAMDNHLILEFDTQVKAQTCLNIINQLAAIYWENQGYTVIDTANGKAVVGKNALTGEDEPSALTTTWDIVKQSPDNNYYISDPAQNQNYALWLERATALGYVFDGVQREIPAKWLESK